MAVSVSCTSCGNALTFSSDHSGSIQECGHCGQKIIVPGNAEMAPSSSQLVPQKAPQTVAAQTFYSYQQERAQAAQSSRKLKMGSGCFAMLAVMFAVALMAAGFGQLFEINKEKLLGLSMLVAGMLGLMAFVYFGYIATETAISSSDRGRT